MDHEKYLDWLEELEDNSKKFRFYCQLGEHCLLMFEKFEEIKEYLARIKEYAEESLDALFSRVWGKNYERFQIYEFFARSLYREAIAYGQQAVEAGKRGGEGSIDHICNASWLLARSYEGLGKWNESLKSCHDIITWGTDNSLSTRIIKGHAVLGRVYASMGEWEKVINECEIAMSYSPSGCAIPWIAPQLADAYCKIGQMERGIRLLEQRKTYAKRYRRGAIVECEYCLPLAENYLLKGNTDKAFLNAKEALDVALEYCYPMHEAQAHRILGEIYAPTDFQSAEEHLARSLEIMQRIKARNEEGKTELSWGRACQQHGDIDQARAHLTRAAEIFGQLGTTRYLEWTQEALAELE